MNRCIRILVALAFCAALGGLAPDDVRAEGAKVAVFHLNGPLIEKPQGDFGLSFSFEPVTLKDMIERFDEAKSDDDIRALLITVGQPSMGLAQIEELRQAISDVGKPVYVHVDYLNTGLYALATAAKHISITPTGDVWLLGFYSETPYLRGLLDKIHVEPDVVHIGDFKAAGEILARTGPSEPAKANMNWLYDGLYDSLLKMIADSRFNGDVDKARKRIDGGPYTAEMALKAGLIDSVTHRQDLVAELKEKYGDDLKFVRNYGAQSGPDFDIGGNPFAVFQMLIDLMSGEEESTETSVAIVYVEGMIVPGADDPSPFGGSSGAKSTTIRRALDKAADDESVKAVVLRIDSPGGSALASEIIYDATQRVRAAGKPVVASMGNVAASGGYYVACGADHIVADPTTITASIGVVGVKLVTTGMWDSIGINWHSYQRGQYADIMGTANKWSDDQRNKILTWMGDVYAVFKGHIVDHRGEKLTKPIDEMAGGRVYTGTQALELGLVDELGTFADAVDKAANLASVADYKLRVLPRPKTIFDIFRDSIGDQESESVRVASAAPLGLFAADSPLTDMILPMLKTLDPQRAKTLTQALMRLNLYHTEHVVVVTPQDWLIRFD